MQAIVQGKSDWKTGDGFKSFGIAPVYGSKDSLCFGFSNTGKSGPILTEANPAGQ